MAARFCPQCGQEVASTARFCANCAAPLTPTVAVTPTAGAVRTPSVPPVAPNRTVTNMEMAASGTRRLLVPAVIAAVLVLAIAVAVLAGRLHENSVLASQSHPALPGDPLLNQPSSPAAPGAPLLSQPSTNGVPAPALTNAPSRLPGAAPALTNAPSRLPSAAPALTNAPSRPATPGPALTNAPSVKNPGLPPDVDAYLKFLKSIEDRRVALSNDASGATGMLQTARQMQAEQNDQSDPDSHNQSVQTNVSHISQGYGDYTAKWQALIRDFRAYPPPAPCQPLAGQYLSFLTGYAATISKLQVALMNGDLGAAMGAQGAQKQINAGALQADDALGQLCAQYNAPKPFSIQPDGASSSLLGM